MPQPFPELCRDRLAAVSGGVFRLRNEPLNLHQPGLYTAKQYAVIRDTILRLHKLGLDEVQSRRIVSKHRDVLIPMR